jgi:hypothetical protein
MSPCICHRDYVVAYVSHGFEIERRGKERKGKERKGKERRGEESKGRIIVPEY